MPDAKGPTPAARPDSPRGSNPIGSCRSASFRKSWDRPALLDAVQGKLMDEKEIKLTAQLMAIEHLLARLYAIHYLSTGQTLEQVKAIHKRLTERARIETFPTVGPELSDHAAAEYETELERLLHAVECLVGTARDP